MSAPWLAARLRPVLLCLVLTAGVAAAGACCQTRADVANNRARLEPPPRSYGLVIAISGLILLTIAVASTRSMFERVQRD